MGSADGARDAHPFAPLSSAARAQTILGNLIGSEYEYLMKGTLRHEHAEKAAAACTSAAIMYGATLIASCVCICTDRGDGKQAPGKE